MKTSNKILIVAIMVAFIFAVIAGFSWKKFKNQKQKNNTLAEKIDHLNDKVNFQNEIIAIQQELKEIPPLVDSILTNYGLKLKNVHTVTNVYHKTVFDTIRTEKDEYVEGESIIKFDFDENCLFGEGFVDFSRTTITPGPEDWDNLDIYLTNINYTDTTTTIYFFDRKKVKLFFIKLKIGRKQFYAQTHSSCKKEAVKTEYINFKKR